MFLLRQPLFQSCLPKSPKVTYLARRSGSGFKSEAEQVYQVFANSATWYDRLIDLASFGQQNHWKRELVKMIELQKGTRLVDVAGGQGAIAIRCLKFIQDNKIEDCELSVCDVNGAMLEQGQKTLTALNFNPNTIRWVQGDAQNLPFPDQSFNSYVISLGFRGIDVDKTFQEAHRVLKPGSRVYCMEIQRSPNFLVDCVHWFSYKHILPIICQVMFKTREPFAYFVKMYPKIPNREKIKAIMEKAGFSQVEYKNLSWGIAAIHWGYKK